MPRIQNTNLLIDDFAISRRDQSRTYSHILTHVHTDHLKGLYDGWNCGKIYCTEKTARLLLLKYPSLTCLETIEYNSPTVLKMSQSLEVTITLLDANHMSGSAMVLIEGYLGRILYCGDIRFDRQIYQNYHFLYPPQLSNQEFVKCSKHIDVLYLDNTFLKAKFKFPHKKIATQMVIKHIEELLEKNQHSHIYLALDSIGKEQILTSIAEHFEMLVAVEQSRYENIKAMDFDMEMFTTNPKQSIIQVIKKNTLYKCLKDDPNATGIVLSGWVNSPFYRYDNRIYCIPYSLHSNYDQLHQFVASIGPSELYPIVNELPNENQLFYAQSSKGSKHQLFFNQQTIEATHKGYSFQLDELKQRYCKTPMSDEYRNILKNVEIAKNIEEQLKRKTNSYHSNEIRTNGNKPPKQQVGKKNRYQFANQRNQDQIKRLKNQISFKKHMRKRTKSVISLDGDSVQQVNNSSSKSKYANEVIEIDQDQDENFLDQIPLQIQEKKYDPLFGQSPLKKVVLDLSSEKQKKTNHSQRLFTQEKSIDYKKKQKHVKNDLGLLYEVNNVTLLTGKKQVEQYLKFNDSVYQKIAGSL